MVHEVQKSKERFPRHARTLSKPLEVIQSDIYREKHSRAIVAITVTLSTAFAMCCGVTSIATYSRKELRVFENKVLRKIFGAKSD